MLYLKLYLIFEIPSTIHLSTIRDLSTIHNPTSTSNFGSSFLQEKNLKKEKSH
jgi:hypothetical protein